MPSSTTRHSIPFPLGADPIAGIAATQQAQAMRIDGILPRFATGDAVYSMNGSGQVTITHGLGSTPASVNATHSDNASTRQNPYVFRVVSRSASNFVLEIRRADTGALHTGSLAINWLALNNL